MQDEIGETADTRQRFRPVEIGKQRYGAGVTPTPGLLPVAHQGENTVALTQPGQRPPGDVAAANDKKSFHRRIVSIRVRSPACRTRRRGNMSFTVTIQPSGHTLSAESGESILDAALRQGLTLPYGCRDGACGACRGKVLSGTVDNGKAQAQALSDADRANGLALFCCAKASSDLVI